MKRLDNKGFTLVELIAVIVLLSLVMGIGGFVVTKILNSSREKDYALLIENIKNAAEDYYIECKYGKTSGGSLECTDGVGDSYNVTLGKLVEYGFLTGNEKKETGGSVGGSPNVQYTLVNPKKIDPETKTNVEIYNCNINVAYNNGIVSVSSIYTEGMDCPNEY